jgi:hypothetical protein
VVNGYVGRFVMLHVIDASVNLSELLKCLSTTVINFCNYSNIELLLSIYQVRKYITSVSQIARISEI